MKYRNLFYGTLIAVSLINLSCAQELTTADGLVAPGTCDAKTLRPCIAHIFPKCMVRVDALPEGSLPQSQNVGGIDMYVSLTSLPYMMGITVLHEAAQSSITIQDYVQKSIDEFAAKGIDARNIKKAISGNFAIVEVQEMVVCNLLCHSYQKIMRTPIGFTVVSGTCEVMKWPEVESTIKKCVNSASMISWQEVEMLEKHGSVIGVDVDNDFFIKAGYAVNPSAGKATETTAGRYYFLKPSKSFRQTQSNSCEEKSQAAKFGNVSDGLIHTLFGYTISSEIQDLRKARRLNDKTMRIQDTLKLKDPFRVCKNVSLLYTPNNFRLFQLKLESDVFVSPDLSKMKARLKEIADAIDKKFGGLLVMNSSDAGLSFTAKFFRGKTQSLTVRLIDDTKTGPGKAKIRGKKFQIVFVDELIRNTEESYE